MRKAQVFTLDLIVAVVILITTAIIVASILPSKVLETTEDDAKILADALFEPFPTKWNQTSVVRPGFVYDYVVDQNNFTLFDSIGENDISSILGLRSFYHIQVKNSSATILETGTEPTNSSYVSVVRRIAIYQQQIVTVQVSAWE